MEFKKVSKNSIQIKPTNSLKVMLEIKDDGYYSIKVVEGDDISSLERPGEYGIKGLHFVLLEDKTEDFMGKPNVASVSDTLYLNIVILGKNFELSKEAIDKMPDANIVVAPFVNDAKLKSILRKIGPEFIVFVEEFAGFSADEKAKANIQSDFPIASEDSKINISEKDLSEDEDSSTVSYLLK
ncbi:hypothetical protein KC678_03230 [Candidatus Dojkabacteria bacterium]|uniref:Uncharacterized protein n=1 Tax=Candidatus Dojkabacteria bacterium TaxID=2099670 RepID=A0A955IFF9_9BACT|nr:hypothetical protein [Candidatus Dojkabacteria bacterium]